MSEIDWDKAPEWANVLLEHECVDGRHCWAESFNDLAKAKNAASGVEFTLDVRMWRLVSERPSPAWSGEGLPPVGVDLQWFSSVYGWIGGKVVAHDEQTTIVRHNDGYEGCYLHNLKPCKNPEQIAADEREEAIKEMTANYAKNYDTLAGWAAYVYDTLGYRKP